MAIKLAISQSQYSKIERGEQKLSFERIVKITEILGIEVKYLVGIDQKTIEIKKPSRSSKWF